MEKKDIYEHLAKIYLDSSTSLKKKQTKKVSRDYKNTVLISVAVILGILVIISSFPLNRNRLINPQRTFVLSADPVKVSYNFNPAKKEIYSLNLNKANLSPYKTLGFSLKKANYSDIISLRIEFTNIYKEKAEVYLNDIPNKWQEYTLALSDFKNITDWLEMENLAFIVEEWNSKENKGQIYLDNIRLIR